MDSKATIVSVIWLAVAVISAMYLYVGGLYWGTDIAVGLLVLIAFMLTFVVGFGLEYFQAKMDNERPQTKTMVEMSNQLADLKTSITDLTKKVDAIQKELQE